MSYPTFSGEDVLKALKRMNYEPVRQKGDHVFLKYKHPETGETRSVVVPLHDEIKEGTLKSIANQCGANDFENFKNWIDNNC